MLLRTQTGPQYLISRKIPSEFQDVRLVGSDGSVRAHRVFLGAACALLKSCLLDPALLGSEEEPVILLPDYSASDIEGLLCVLYGKNEYVFQGHEEIIHECRFQFGPSHPEEIRSTNHVIFGKNLPNKCEISIKEEDSVEEAFKEVEESCDKVYGPGEIFSENDNVLSDTDGDNDDDDEYEAPSSSEDKVRKRKRGRPKASISKSFNKNAENKRSYKRNLYSDLDFGQDPERPENMMCPNGDCTFSHAKRSSIIQHINIVHNKVKCPHCHSHLSKTTLSEHIARRHTKQPTQQCENCSKMYYSKRDLEAHRNKDHGIATEHIVCDLCGKNFSSRVVYGNHRFKCKINPVRREMVPYTCILNPEDPTLCPAEDCGYRHKSSVAIKRHYRKKHERQICPHCGKTYAYYGMKEHIAKEHNTKDLKFSCDSCSEKFFNETSLREHKEMVHIREPLYVCDKCGQGFFSRKQVARHKNEAHNKLKDNPCHMCNKVYRHKKSLRNHMSTAHGALDMDQDRAAVSY